MGMEGKGEGGGVAAEEGGGRWWVWMSGRGRVGNGSVYRRDGRRD